MKQISAVLFLSGLLTIYSCSTDFDLNADFVETPVVFALLDASDSTHYIRVNRAFLSDQVDALTLAQDIESIYYGDELTVTVEELNFGSVVNSYVLERIDGDTIGIEKDTTGIFASLPNILYRFSAPLNEDHVYRVTVENSETGKVAQGSTEIIDNFKITRPNEEALFPQYFSLSPQGSYQFSFLHARDAATYDFILRFHYRTARYFQSGDSIQITGSGEIDWKFRKEYNAIDRLPNESITIDVPGVTFYNFLADAFPADPDQFNIRLADSIQFLVEAGGEEIYNYQLFNNSTLGLTEGQAVEPYSNVTDGLGLVSTRFHKVGLIFPISIQTRDSIGCSTITSGHNFTPDQSKLGFPFCN